MDEYGRFRLVYGNRSIDFGTVTSYSEPFSKSCMVVPLVSLPEDRTFAVETGCSMRLSLRFTRVTPESPDDSSSDTTKWSNGKWYSTLSTFVDRWQCLTDGFKLIVEPGDENPYIPDHSSSLSGYGHPLNGYVKNLIRTFSAGNPTVITGTLDFYVGTMYVKNKRATPFDNVKKTDFHILMSNSEISNWFDILDGSTLSGTTEAKVDCVKSFTMTGGVCQPFEMVTMTIPRNRLASVAPELVDDIVAGKNKLIIDAVGRSYMTVVKCKLRNKNYSITAYCNAEVLKGYVLNEAINMTPFDAIKHILTSGMYGTAFVDSIDASVRTFHYHFNPKNSSSDSISFDKGINTWYVLQVCAIYLGCKIFFTNNCAYLIDYSLTSASNTSGSDTVYTFSDKTGYILDLYTEDTNSEVYGRVCDSVELGDEGFDTVVNTQLINYSKSKGSSEMVKAVVKDDASIDKFGERDGNSLNIKEFTSDAQVLTFGKELIKYRSEPQQSMTFTLKEMENNSGVATWVPFFPPVTCVREINDTVDEVNINNESVTVPGTRKPQKLILSQFSRNYPQGTSTYSFGIMQNINLASSTSEILTNQK